MKKSSRIFITGSADGLGLLAGQQLLAEGHSVVFHARNAHRANEVKKSVSEATTWVTGDLSSIAETKSVADQVNALGQMDAVIHNAAVGYQELKRVLSPGGFPHVFAINTLAPYILTAQIQRPKRLIYLSSGLHQSANTLLDDLLWQKRLWRGIEAYSDTKFHDTLIAFGIARLWPEVFSNALEPGWVPTKMGGAGAPDDLNEGFRTQTWLAVSDDALAKRTGEYYFHKKLCTPHPDTHDIAKQNGLFAQCEKFSGVKLT